MKMSVLAWKKRQSDLYVSIESETDKERELFPCLYSLSKAETRVGDSKIYVFFFQLLGLVKERNGDIILSFAHQTL